MTQTSTVLRAIICEIAAVNFNSVADTPKVAESPIDRILTILTILKRAKIFDPHRKSH